MEIHCTSGTTNRSTCIGSLYNSNISLQNQKAVTMHACSGGYMSEGAD